MPEQPDLTNFLPLVRVTYQYQDQDIVAILDARIDDIHEKEPNAFNKQVFGLSPADSPRTLRLVLEGEKGTRSFPRILLIPYHLQTDPTAAPQDKSRGHWVGILLEIDENGNSCRSIYIDPLNQYSPDSDLRHVCLNVHHGVSMQIACYMRQQDGTSCGPIMIENLLYAARNINRFPETADSALLRALHLECLSRKRQDIYMLFVGRQEETTFAHFVDTTTSMLFRTGIFSSSHASAEIGSSEDDLLITLVILNRLFDNLLNNSHANNLSLKPRKFLRDNYKSVRTDDGKLHLVPRSLSRVKAKATSLERDQMIPALTQEIRTAMWDLQRDRRSDVRILGKFSMLLLAVGFGYSSGVLATGTVGAAKRAELVNAIFSNTAKVPLGGAVTSVSSIARINNGWRSTGPIAGLVNRNVASASLTTVFGNAVYSTVTNPWVIVPSLVFGAVQLAQLSESTHISECVQRALDLYQTGCTQNDPSRFAIADRNLCTAMGISGNGSKGSGSTWALIASDQFAYACLLLGTLRVKQGLNNAYELFADAFHYANEDMIKQQSLLWMILTLSHDSPSKTTEVYGNIIDSYKLREMLEEKVRLLNRVYPDIAKDCHTLTNQSIKFVMNMIVNGNASTEDITAFIGSGDICNIRNIQPHGKVCELIFAFMQAVCMRENRLDATQKFRECNALAEALKAGRELNLEAPQDVIIQEIIGYIQRNIRLGNHDAAAELQVWQQQEAEAMHITLRHEYGF